ncbi:MAG: polyribonucleotide nucleotidyltransferase [candidate division KSB1 bacterium]|nr:polyribonucleotide nucleotidyltransferase [candidate division KSB1 bacterium]MDZ7275477.1 polyribonucleotide nucleotidyltransferase [candidate division KSB1 bacterium]MDZ7286211.1 polyribonucleotide nucleotidyltransferase [candidate division KSB1 bacterium]MDZ7296437.1 polyribonucleotide nucleotidyltransferase [candidate division KSB1 bacterium]MDZ7307233.1 polyribonucleotide nucleotidyltransferase [candidate division KSB1 bacterium]
MLCRKETELNGKVFAIETGRVARQADGACWVQFGDTIVLATVVGDPEAKPDVDFFPLTVDYREKAYAAGKIPGGFFKREGKPSENEILSARLIDRGIRPLFPEDYNNEVQVMVSVLSADKENDPDVLGISAASMAIMLSGIPWHGPLAGVRVGRVNGKFIANPTHADLESSDMDLVLAATEDSIIMVEGEAQEISEADMVAALTFGHDVARRLIQVQKAVAAEAAKPPRPVIPVEMPAGLENRVREAATETLRGLLRETDKQKRRDSLKQYAKTLVESLQAEFPESEAQINTILHKIEKEIVRAMIVHERRRLDGRDWTSIRDITCEVGVLPRVHGTCIFTRGQTQALAAVTLGTKVDEQKMDELEGEFYKSYMLHYNFPPFSVGEIRRLGGPGRREVGHGNLAERSIKAVMPNEKVFPYTVRVVSDILESNGSSSMATVCAGSLALMDAGVPIKSAVAGIAMGLIQQDGQTVILTDILGDEDHLGDMDFKVAGTAEGITGFQMDIKIKGLSSQIMAEALEQARRARLHILNIMNATLSKPRPDISPYAPRILTIKIPTDSIGMVIGPGGKTIRDITERTGTTIDIDDSGVVTIAGVDPQACHKAKAIIQGMVAEPELGTIYQGTVKSVKEFGAFVEILPGREGLLHISQIDNRRIARVEDVLKVGDEVTVKLIEIAPDGKLRLSRKALLSSDS